MSAITLKSPFQIGDIVNVDGCRDLRAVVIGLLFRSEDHYAELSWFSGGAVQTALFEYWRLTKVTGYRNHVRPNYTRQSPSDGGSSDEKASDHG